VGTRSSDDDNSSERAKHRPQHNPDVHSVLVKGFGVEGFDPGEGFQVKTSRGWTTNTAPRMIPTFTPSGRV